MRGALFAAIVVASACSVALPDPAGRACDDTHGCHDGRVCRAGLCVDPSGVADAAPPGPVASDAGGGCGDAGACAEGTFCASGACRACTYVASPTGSDAASGSRDAPFATVARLAAMLGPDAVGCLRAGTYTGDVMIDRGGRSGAPAMLRSFPGERAKLVGRVLVRSTASFLVLADLDVDGTNTLGDSSPVVLATDVTVEGCDLTSKNRDGCLRIGDPEGADASRAVVRNNRIHDCGAASTNSASGIKVANASDVVVSGNVVYGCPDHGILIYPLARRTHATGNVLDGNGRNVVFGGTKTQTSNDNIVEHSILSSPVQPDNVAAFFDPASVGQGNVVRQSCLFGGGGEGGVPPSPVGFTATDNVVGDPRYVDRASHDYRLSPGSPCLAVFP